MGIITVADFIKENDPGRTTLNYTNAVEIKEKEDLDRWISHFSIPGVDTTDLLLKTSWFVAGVAADRTDREEALAYILSHSFHINHCVPNNMITKVVDGKLLHVATVDIEPGDELFLDYSNM